MSVIKPFLGLRPRPDLADRVASLPYDVMDTNEARSMVEGNPYSFLHVTRSEVDLDPHIDPYDPQVYRKARENMERFIQDGIMIQDEAPCFYIYKQVMGSHTQIGLVATASVDEYQNGQIKKHELTRADKEQDRVNHVNTTGAQTGPVFLTYRNRPELTALISRAMDNPPIYDFSAGDGIRHTLFVVSERRMVAAIQQEFAQIDTMYIADGHHRSASASIVRDLRKSRNPEHTGDEPYNFFLAVIFPHDMLHIMDYNRVVRDLNGLTVSGFLEQIGHDFHVEQQPAGTKAFRPKQRHQFGMYLDSAWYCLIPREGSFNAADPVESLDVSILQNRLLNPVLNIDNPRTDKRINFVGGIRGMAELERLVNSGQYAVAFSLHPTSIDELMSIADAGEIMPPKSTWFEPKLRDAMVVHLI